MTLKMWNKAINYYFSLSLVETQQPLLITQKSKIDSNPQGKTLTHAVRMFLFGLCSEMCSGLIVTKWRNPLCHKGWIPYGLLKSNTRKNTLLLLSTEFGLGPTTSYLKF
jgi:hypothetical protein